jgi:hypothetical protein
VPRKGEPGGEKLREYRAGLEAIGPLIAAALFLVTDVRGILLICPHRENRTKESANDGRVLRRYKRRYKVERSLSWLYNFRRLITRWEYYPELFQSFVHLACLLTILKRF